jgi:hypothetical protein
MHVDLVPVVRELTRLFSQAVEAGDLEAAERLAESAVVCAGHDTGLPALFRDIDERTTT